MSSKKRCMILLLCAVILLGLAGGLTVIVDPFFHYHAPLSFLQYPVENQRYQNDGIVRHFDYNAIITGTSMTENFKASELNALFGVQSVKTCFSGSSYKEIHSLLQRAVRENPDLRLVVRGLDAWNLFDDKDLMRTDAQYPDYLYDDSLLNDVNYIFNKDILCCYTLEVLKHTLKGLPTTDFDTYSSWESPETGTDIILTTYQRPAAAGSQSPITEAQIQNVRDTLEQNVISLARENPDIQFYYFFTPYSIFYMDEQQRYGTLQAQFDALRLASDLLMEYDNIHLFSFFDAYDIITDPDNYKDTAHYGAHINSYILQSMAAGDHLLTPDNHDSYWDQVAQFYLNYDYDTLFA